MGINVLGPLTVDGPGRLGPHDRVVLQALATRLGRPVSPDELADAVWGDHPPASAAKNLQSCIVRLRKVLGTGSIETSPHGYALTVPADHLDANEFETQVGRARSLLTVGESDRVAFLLDQALAQWRGPAFADLPEWPPARREAGRLDDLRLEAQEMQVDAMLRSGRAREVLAQAHAMVRAAPLRERRWELLVLAQYQTGAQGEALRSVRRLRAVLARELGIDPSPEMLALEQSILHQDPRLLVPQPRPEAAQCPWQGLKAYDVDDTERFFGRDADVAACLAILDRGSFVALVGPSGSGKSSLLRAGVLATLRRRGHRVVLVSPGPHPMQSLSALGADAPSDTVLAVDQGEEVFALCDDLEERRTFLERLAEEAQRRPVLVTVRGDRLGQVTEHAGFSHLVEGGLHLVGALDEEGLRQAVERPAEQAGLVIEHGLVDVLVGEVRDDPGALPLLSHALLETWQRREGNTLTVDGYRASGGIHGAVAQSAEQLYGRIAPEQRRQLRDLVLRLVSPGAEGEAVRTRVPRRLVAPAHDRLVEALVAARLVTSDEGVLEITHEALTRAWPRLRGWLEDDVEGQRIRHHLSDAADAWDSLGRPASELYRGVRLTRVLDWQSRAESTLTDTEQDFLDAAREASDAEERSAAEHARVQASMIRRLRIVLGGAVVLLVLALAAGGLAAVQSERASNNAARAEQAALSADARRVGARAQLTQDISLSLLLAVAGARLDDSPETRTSLLTALAEQPLLVRSAPPGGGYLDVFDVSRDGRWIAASDDQNRMHLYDAATNRLLDSYDAGRNGEDGPRVLAAAFSPDSKRLAVILHGSESTEPVRLLDPNTMEPATELAFPGGKAVWAVDARFSADGRHLATTVQTVDWPTRAFREAPSYALVWDLRSPSTLPIKVSTGVDVQGMALSPDGGTLYTGWPLTAYDVATGERIWRRGDLTTWYTALDLNREGTLLAIGDQGDQKSARDVLLVNPVTGDTVRTLRGHRSTVNDIRFSPDGRLVGSVSNDGELIVWDTAAGRPIERWDTFDPYSVGIGPGNDLVHGGGLDSMLRTWDLSVQDTYLSRTTQVDNADAFAWAHLSPDGDEVAYRWVDGAGRGWVRFVDTETGARTPPTRLPAWDGSPWVPGAWHPAGGRYAAYWCDGVLDCALQPGSVRVLESATGKLLQQEDVLGGDRDIYGIAYVDDGRGLLLMEGLGHFDDLDTSIVDAETLLPVGDRLDVPANCCATSIGGDGTAMVYEASRDLESGHVRMLDVNTGEVIAEGEVDLLAYTSTASPDGSIVAVAGKTGEIVTFGASTGDEQRRSTSRGAAVQWLDYSDDGELLVSGAADGGVSLWDAETLDLLGTVHPPHRGEPVPAGAQFIGDTHDVVIASYDGTIYRWETGLDRAIDFACQMAGRDLTETEWAQVLPAQPFRSVCPQD